MSGLYCARRSDCFCAASEGSTKRPPYQDDSLLKESRSKLTGLRCSSLFL